MKLKKIFSAIIIINMLLLTTSFISRRFSLFGHSTYDVYHWAETNLENSTYNELFMTEKQCRELINKACAQYEITSPELDYRANETKKVGENGITTGMYNPMNDTITLYKIGNNSSIVLHECAHAVIVKKSGLAKRFFTHCFSHSHNREFISVYYDLLVECGGFDSVYLDRTMEKHGIKK